MDKSDEKVHVRANPSAPTSAPVLCGKTNQTSVSEAWGFWGPGGAGFSDVCQGCFKIQKEKRG